MSRGLVTFHGGRPEHCHAAAGRCSPAPGGCLTFLRMGLLFLSIEDLVEAAVVDHLDLNQLERAAASLQNPHIALPVVLHLEMPARTSRGVR